MPSFKYIATSSKNQQTINGSIEAPDESAVIDLLNKQKLRPLSITLDNSQTSLLSRFFSSGRVKSSDLVNFTRQLSTMLSAGVPLLKAFSSLQQHIENIAFKDIVGLVTKDLEAGAALADALAKHPSVFDDVYVNMVRAGESAGILDGIFKRLAVQQEKNASIKKRVKGAMAYPITIISVTIVAFFGLMIFVVPQIEKIIKDIGGGKVELPFLTKFMLGVSSLVIQWWPIIVPLLLVGLFLLFRYVKNPVGKRLVDRLALKIPVVKSVVQKVVIARFARTFAALSSAGLPLLEIMTVTAHGLGNSVYEESLISAIKDVKSGKLLSKSIEESNLYPSIVPQMLAVGEETGATEAVLLKLADFYDEEVDVALGQITSLIEPAVIILLGLIVALIAISVMGPIASLTQNISS